MSVKTMILLSLTKDSQLRHVSTYSM